jgi:hypothetical protein
MIRHVSRHFSFNQFLTGRDCVTVSGDQIFARGVMAGGYVNPHRLHILKYRLFGESLDTLTQLWEDQSRLENQMDCNGSGMSVVLRSSFQC